MPVSLLRSKLFSPPPRSAGVTRSRLLAALAAGRSRKMTLISAPAGFGKSTLAAAWAATEERVAWFSLDASDNNLRRFLRYLDAVLCEADCGYRNGLAELLAAPRVPDAETLVARLTGEMHGKESVLLVLDDYHTIDNPAVHELVETLLAYQPRSLHLVVVTREDPPLPLSRLRARGELNEVRTRALRFTRGEVDTFLKETMGLALNEEQIETLAARTEGWIAGLQLAALSLQRSSDPEAFVAAFAGNDRYVLDYLMDEVFAQQPAAMQRFLLQTSVLERMSGDLAEAVVEGERPANGDFSSLLVELERANLFVVPLDNRREWYRYHHLFADLLRYRLRQQQPALVPRLHGRASKWYEVAGYVNEAVDHALRAGDDERVAQLIERHGSTFFAANEMRAVLTWSGELPATMVSNRPTLLMIRAWAALSSGQPAEAEQSVGQIERVLEVTADELAAGGPGLDPETRGAMAEVAVVRAVMATDRKEAEQAVRMAQRALSALEKEADTLFHKPQDLRGIALSPLASAYELLGDVGAAQKAAATAVTISREEGNVHIRALASGRLGRLSAQAGRLDRAEQYYQEVLAEDTATGSQSPYRCVAHAGLGALRYERNELAAAAEQFRAAISLARPLSHWETLIPAYTGLARVVLARGEHEEAAAALDALERLHRLSGLQTQIAEVEALRIRLALKAGKTAAAARRAGRLAKAGSHLAPQRELVAMVRARVLLAQEAAEEALALVTPLVAAAEAAGRQSRVLALYLLRALALDAAERRAEALESLEGALCLGQEEGYVRVFVDEGEPLARLLYAAVAANLFPAYGGELLNVFAFAAEEPDRAVELVEPLTAREEEVLAAVAEGMTNREIAEALSIALGTVKVHTYNIYGKLGVGNRVEAVARGRALGILSHVV